MQHNQFLNMMARKERPVSILKDFNGHSRWKLQLFAEEAEDEGADEPGDPKEDEKGEGPKPEDKPGKDERTYNDAEVDRIVAKHKAEWEKAHAKDVADAKAEAEKLAKMNKEQKEAYEQEKLKKDLEAKEAEIQRLKAEALRSELSKQASRTMKEDHEIVATQDMLDFVVGDDAETTNANIKKLVGIIQDDRKAQDEKRAAGRTPKNYQGGGAELTEIEKRIRKYT